MDDAIRARAEARYADALAAAGLRDPREQFRGWLRRLKESDPAAYREELAHYQSELLPASAEPEGDAVSLWIEYGRRLADRIAPGAAVSVDAGGRSMPWAPPAAPGAMVLHLPHAHDARASVLSLPLEPSAAQLATYDLLVAGKLAPGRATTE